MVVANAKSTPIAWEIDNAFQLLCRHLGGTEVAREELQGAVHTGKVGLLRWDTSVPGWEHDPPKTLSADAARLTRLCLDEGYAIVLTRDPSGRPAECVLSGETWYHNGNLHYVILHDDLVALWSIFAQVLDPTADRGIIQSDEMVDEAIRVVIREMYDEAERHDNKPQNINQLVDYVQPRVELRLGSKITGLHIRRIGSEVEFQRRRLPQGRRWS